MKWLFQNKSHLHSFISKSNLKANTHILNILPKRRFLADDFLLFFFFFLIWPEPSRDKRKKPQSDSLRKKGVRFYLYFRLPLCVGRSGEQSPFLAHTFFFFLPVRLRFFSVFVFVHFVVNLIKEEKGIAKLLNNNYLSACVQWCRQCCFI